MPNIDLSILNQRQTPAFYADTLANRPAAGFVGRIFVSTNTLDLYRDNGTTWDLLSPSSTGTITGSGAAGQVTYFSAASSITGSNNLFWDSINNRLGVNTNAPTASFDVHSASNTIAQFNQTVATNDTRIAFQNGGSSLWRIGNLYNAGANDFEIFDVVGALQSLTVKKTTGQVLIGTSTVGSGKLVVRSASSDNGIQIVGATAPSLRIDSAETGPTKRIGLAIATNTNNFIQGSADRDMCIFNGSTTASPMLFGIYDAGAVSVQEAARISAARNFLIGTTTDAGYKFDVNGAARVTGSIYADNTIRVGVGIIGTSSNNLALSSNTTGGEISFWNNQLANRLMTLTGAGSLGIGTNSPATTLEVLGLNEGEYFRGGAGTISGRSLAFSNYTISGTVGVGHRINAQNAGGALSFAVGGTDRLTIASTGAATFSNDVIASNGKFFVVNTYGYFFGDNSNLTGWQGSNGTQIIQGFTGGSERLRVSSSGNLLIGTTTDNGAKLQVNGNTTLSATSTPEILMTDTGSGRTCLIANDSNNAFFRTANGNNFLFQVSGGATALTIKSTRVINISAIPTSPAGLVSGDIYSNLGVLTIVP